MRNILFIIPPCHEDFNIDFEIAFPNHILYLMHFAEKAGWNSSFIDMTLEEKEGFDSFELLKEKLINKSFDLVGISNHTVRTVPTTSLVASFIKEIINIPVIVGGLNASFMWDILLKGNLNIDFIIKGFGQEPIYEFLKSYPNTDTQTIPGLIWRNSETFHTNNLKAVLPEYFLIEDLNKIDIKRYLKWTSTYCLNSHFGCNYNCNFCTSNMPDLCQKKELIRPVNDVIKEIKLAHKNGFTSFFMNANNFTSNKIWLREFADSVYSEKLLLSWSCMSRIEYIDKDVINYLDQAGCKNIAVGIESANNNMWNELNKGNFRKAFIISVFQSIRQKGIETTVYLIVGLPNQKENDINETISFTQEIDPDNRVISFFQPYPGTTYWKLPHKYGIKSIVPFNDWNLYEYPVCETDYMTKEEIYIAAIRLYVEVGSGINIDIHKHKVVEMEALDSFKQILPEEVHLLLSKTTDYSIYKSLNFVSSEYGKRGVLICLYWLHYFFRNRIINYA
jgi:anaerobic magnesium-protoporphyrin IX monomethyl ester cyclase